MNPWLTPVILGIECVFLVIFFSRAIGWKPRWRWETELMRQALEAKIERLEHRLQLLEGRSQLIAGQSR